MSGWLLRVLGRVPRLWIIMACLLVFSACSPPAQEQGRYTQEPLSVLPTSPLVLETPTPVPAVPEARLLVLEWPAAIRSGDSDIVRLTLELDEEGNLTPVAETPGNQVRGEPVQIPNLYDTHNVLAEARLEMAGPEINPVGETIEPMLQGQPVIFLWSVRPTEVGSYRGTIWVHLNFVPKDPSSGEVANRILLSAQVIEINSVNLFGLGGAAARVMGGVGMVFGSLLGLDTIVNIGRKLFRVLFGRRRKAE